MTNSQFVSRVINSLKSTDKDSRISRRYILFTGRQKAAFYISQKLRDMSLFREDNLISQIDCFSLKKDEIKKCDIVEFRRCNSVMKSKKKLPELIYSRLGSSLKEVTTIDSQKEFKYTTPSQFRRDKKRKGESPYIYYYVKDGYLYLLDCEIKRVDVSVITLNTEDIPECSDCQKEDCKSAWDYEFIVPNKLSEVVMQETLKEVSMTLQIPADENPDMDSNIKSQTTK